MNKKGFTLAEVLITLGIIGVIAALTMPAIVNSKPNEEKIAFINMYDSVSNKIHELANNSRYFPACQQLTGVDEGGNNVINEYCFPGFPLYNTSKGIDNVTEHEGDYKICNLLAEAMNAVTNNCNAEVHSFILSNNQQFIFNVARQFNYNAENSSGKFLMIVEFDVNGNGTPNCSYSNVCQNPDRFRIAFTADGEGHALDQASQYYLSTRRNLKQPIESNKVKRFDTVNLTDDDMTVTFIN
mgnify:CR=1 FL=1